MDQAIKYITERFTRKLSRSQDYFTPADLLEAGLPPFLTGRIRIELETNLAESVHPPQTDWADMSVTEVHEAWEHFLDTIHAQVRLPQSFAKGVMETCINDLIDLLTEPRKNLPEYIFGSDTELSAEEISLRTRKVLVYRHLVTFIPRYMDNKKLERISRDRYQRAMEQIDDKLSRKFSPLNWAQLLEPLFMLSNGDIEPEFIARFFRDKDMLVLAARFENLQDPVDSQRMIELLSMPVFSEDSYQKPEVVPADDKSGKKTTSADSDKKASAPPKPADDSKSESDDKAEPPKEIKYERPSIISANITAKEETEAVEAETETQADSDSDEEQPLYTRFRNADDEDGDDDKKSENKSAKTKTAEISSKGDPKRKSPLSSISLDEDHYDNIPLWQRLSAENSIDDDTTDDVKTPAEEKEEQQRKNPFANPDTQKPDPKSLEEFLSDDQDNYVREIFKGDEEVYKATLVTLSRFTTWREAGKYLTNDIFRKNRIDMYKDVTVDFTDRLHRYFKERE